MPDASETDPQLTVALSAMVMTVDEIKERNGTIKLLMDEVMIEGEHWGVIPGCGKKPTLLQPGAQKLALAFGLVAEFQIDRHDLEHGHKEYEVTCRMTDKRTGQLVSEGGGASSTKQAKYQRPGRDNPADHYNTAKKMAMKSAYVHATIIGTATSDLFTLDIEDMGDLGHPGEKAAKPKAALKLPPPARSKPAAQARPAQPPSVKDDPEPWATTVDPQDDDSVKLITIARVSKKDGADKTGKSWVKYGICDQDGVWYNTFDQTLGGQAMELKGQQIMIEFEVNSQGYGLDLVAILAEPSGAPDRVDPQNEDNWERTDDVKLGTVEEKTYRGKVLYVVETDHGRFGTHNSGLRDLLVIKADEGENVDLYWVEVGKDQKMVMKVTEVVPF